MAFKFISVLIIVFGVCAAHSASITFQVSSYIGRYNINGGADQSGNKTLTLSPGTYAFNIKFGGTTNFTVNNDGSVTPSDTTIFASSGSTLTLNTLPIYFDIRDYNNKYSISSSSFQGASGTYYLPANLAVSIDTPSANAVATLVSDSQGNINVTAGTDKILGSKNKIFFKTISIKINPGPFDGIYSFIGGNFLAGITSHKLFPNATYGLRTSTAATIGSFQTNSTSLVANTSTYMKTLDDTVYLYTNKYTVTPPSGYNGTWQVYQQGNSTGVAMKWLLLGLQSRMLVGGVTYNFTADSGCSSFNVSTAVGTFSFVCDNQSSLAHNSLSTSDFNNLDLGYTLNKTDGRLSPSINDYAISINGNSHTLANYSLINDTLSIYDVFSEGRNSIVLDGEDSSSNSFQITPVYWAGSGEVIVQTTGATDTVTLDIEQTINSTPYTKSISKQAVNYFVVFKNVPRIDNGTIDISSARNKRVTLRSKIREIENIRL